MRHRLRFAAVALATVVMTAGGMGVLAPAAQGATTGNTTATFSITGGVLSITVPASTVNLGSTAAGSLSYGPAALGSTTVADNRGNLVAVWTVTVSSTDFANTTTGGSSADETVTKANVAYVSGAATNTSGTGAFVPGATTGSGGTGAAFASGIGVNSATWNPTLAFTLRSSQVTGTYSGTITQSVA